MARPAIGLSIAQFAKLGSVSTNTVVRFERGEDLKRATVRRLAATFLEQGVTSALEDEKGSDVFYQGHRIP